MQRETEQLSLADALRPARGRRNAQLQRISGLLDWGPFAAILAVAHALPRGRKAYPALPLYKALLLKDWYRLSDEALEDELWERDSFRRFCGFRAADQIPDHTTLCRFRNELARLGLGQPLFDELQRQLAARNLILQRGRAAIDASLIEAQASRRRAGSAQGPSDPDAAFTRQYGQSHYGYKAHLNVDLDTRLIAAGLLTPANVNDTTVADRLLTGRERSVRADRAYDAHARKALYAGRGIDYEIMERGDKHHPLSAEAQARNRRLSRERMPMEGVFGTFKRGYGYVKVRYYNLERNLFEFFTKCIAYNLRRLERLTAAA